MAETNLDMSLFKTKPWDHQIKAVEYGMKNPSFYLALDMGTGKSKCAIDICNFTMADKVLIIAPKSVLDSWQNQFNIHSKKRYNCVVLKKHSVAKKKQIIEEQMNLSSIKKEPIVIVINYESVWRSPLGPTYKKKAITDPGLISKIDWDYVILDEGHKISSPSSKISWFCKRLGAKARRKLILTGTPMNNPLNIYAQFRFLDVSIFGTNFNLFKNKYAVTINRGKYDEVIDYQNLDELNKKFYSIAYRVTKRDVLKDLPPVSHQYIDVDLDKKTLGLYAELEEHLVTEVEGGELTVNNALTKMLRLSQIAGGYLPLDDQDDGKVIDNNKLDALIEIACDLPEREPIVVFFKFTNELNRAKEKFTKNKRNVSILSGKEDTLKEWQDGETDVILVQIQAGGAGIDLTRACYCFYYSIGFSLLQFNQSLARIDRPGQTRPVTYYHIRAKNTIDRYIYYSIKKNSEIVDNVLTKNNANKMVEDILGSIKNKDFENE